MKNSLITSLILLTLILSTYNGYATQIYSNGTGGGNWNEKSSWTPHVPVCGDTITILSEDIIIISEHQDYEACESSLFLIIDGTLDFHINGKKLFLPCGSGITINVGSCIISTGVGGGADNQIDICRAQVWQTSDGPVCGPKSFGDPLPVKLISFEAEIEHSSAKLTWATASEINNDFFTIERSKNGVDFEFVAEISGSGNSESLKEYSTYDDSPMKGNSYYLLNQTDFDGKTEYFKLVTVNFNINKDDEFSLNVYPNPCVENCTIKLNGNLSNNEQVLIELYDAFGKRIENGISPNYNGHKNSFQLNPINNLAPGIYIIKILAGEESQSSKLIIR